jgi:hypothetical protein
MKRLTLPLLTLLLTSAVLLSHKSWSIPAAAGDIIAFATWKVFGHGSLNPEQQAC